MSRSFGSGAVAIAIVLGVAACGPGRRTGTPPPTDAGPTAQPRQYDPAVEPAPREIIRALLSLRDTPLSIDSSCVTAGTSPEDVDLGDYVSGWLAELREGAGKNWVETSVAAEPDPATGARAWRSAVVFRHVDGDDRWGWGVSFVMAGADHRVSPGSIRCTGAG
jgi:hypothetical protein